MKSNRFVRVTAIAAIAGLTGGLSSCNKALQALKFNLGMQTQTLNITIPPAMGTVAVGPVETVYNVDSFIKAQTSNQLGASNISSVKLASVVLTLDNADSANNFANFSSCNASFYSNTESTPYVFNFPNNPDAFATTLSLPVDSTTDIKKYIGDHFYYNISGSLRRATTKTLNCKVTVNYNIVVQG